MAEISIKRAAMINFIAKYATIFIQLIYNGILSRILIPEDFGIVAVVNVFVTFFMLFADMGIGSAVVQNKTLTEKETNNIFSFTVYLGLVLAAIFALFSIPMSWFYADRVYIPIGLLLSISLFFNTLNMIPNAVLLKNKRFRTVGIRLVVVTIISSILTIVLALNGFKYYSIVFNSIFISFFTFLWNYNSTRLKFSFKISMEPIQKIKEFSQFQFGFNFINYFARNADNLLIGKFLGNRALGFYDKSYRTMLYPVNNLTNVITPVLHPILSDHQNNKEYIYTQYVKVVKILSLLGAFFSAFLFVAAEEVIVILYGDQWKGAVTSFQFLALAVWAQMISSSSGAIFQSLGKTKLLFINGIITSTITVIAIILGIGLQSINAVAAFVAIAYNSHFFITFYNLIKKGFGFNVWQFYKILIPHLLIFFITFLGLYFASLFKIDNVLISAFYKGFVALSFFIIALVLTKQQSAFTILMRRKKRTGDAAS